MTVHFCHIYWALIFCEPRMYRSRNLDQNKTACPGIDNKWMKNAKANETST